MRIEELEDVAIFHSKEKAIALCSRCNEGLLSLDNLAQIMYWTVTHNNGMCFNQELAEEMASISELVEADTNSPPE